MSPLKGFTGLTHIGDGAIPGTGVLVLSYASCTKEKFAGVTELTIVLATKLLLTILTWFATINSWL